MWQQTDGAIFWKLTEGKSPMPSWGESYSEEQRWQVINYVRTLAPPEAGKPQIAKTGGSQ
jgi:mono/diheme cytochrome c family protein